MSLPATYADRAGCGIGDGDLCRDGHRVVAAVDQSPFQRRAGEVDGAAVGVDQGSSNSQGSPAMTSIGS